MVVRSLRALVALAVTYRNVRPMEGHRLANNSKYTKSLLDRFMKYVRVLPNGCWEWTGCRERGGYGQFRVGKRMRKAHHVAWFLKYGYWPDMKTVETDHICHDPKICTLGGKCPHRRCVNPDHLKLVPKYTGGNRSTERSNGGRVTTARCRAITECAQGHPYTPDNTWYDKYGKRHCRKCHRIRERERYRRKKLST